MLSSCIMLLHQFFLQWPSGNAIIKWFLWNLVLQLLQHENHICCAGQILFQWAWSWNVGLWVRTPMLSGLGRDNKRHEGLQDLEIPWHPQESQFSQSGVGVVSILKSACRARSLPQKRCARYPAEFPALDDRPCSFAAISCRPPCASWISISLICLRWGIILEDFAFFDNTLNLSHQSIAHAHWRH